MTSSHWTINPIQSSWKVPWNHHKVPYQITIKSHSIIIKSHEIIMKNPHRNHHKITSRKNHLEKGQKLAQNCAGNHRVAPAQTNPPPGERNIGMGASSFGSGLFCAGKFRMDFLWDWGSFVGPNFLDLLWDFWSGFSKGISCGILDFFGISWRDLRREFWGSNWD